VYGINVASPVDAGHDLCLCADAEHGVDEAEVVDVHFVEVGLQVRHEVLFSRKLLRSSEKKMKRLCIINLYINLYILMLLRLLDE